MRVIAAPPVIASVVISLILVCVYSDITRQVYTKRKILLTKSFSVAKSRFLPLLWTYFLEFLIVALIFGGLIGLVFIAGIIGIILTIIVGAIAIILAVFFFYETPAIVVLENKSGLEAIKRSCSIARRNFWFLVIVILIVRVIVSTVSGGISSVPYIGIILSKLGGLFLNTWNSMIPTVFYYEYEKRKEEV